MCVTYGFVALEHDSVKKKNKKPWLNHMCPAVTWQNSECLAFCEGCKNSWIFIAVKLVFFPLSVTPVWKTICPVLMLHPVLAWVLSTCSRYSAVSIEVKDLILQQTMSQRRLNMWQEWKIGWKLTVLVDSCSLSSSYSERTHTHRTGQDVIYFVSPYVNNFYSVVDKFVSELSCLLSSVWMQTRRSSWSKWSRSCWRTKAQ